MRLGVFVLAALLAPAAARAQCSAGEADVGGECAPIGTLWLEAGSTAPQGLRNPRLHVEPLDLPLFGAGTGTLASGWLLSLFYGLAGVAGRVCYGCRFERFYGSFDFGPHPCREGAAAASVIPVLGPWIAIGALDQCGASLGVAYPNALGEPAYASFVRREVPFDFLDAILFSLAGVIQLTGLGIAIAGLVGQTSSLRFDGGAALELAPGGPRLVF